MSSLAGAGTERRSADDWSLQLFGMHALLFGSFRVRETTRQSWCSDLAVGERPVFCGRLPYTSGRLSVLSVAIRVASWGDHLLPCGYGGSNFISKGAR